MWLLVGLWFLFISSLTIFEGYGGAAAILFGCFGIWIITEEWIRIWGKEK